MRRPVEMLTIQTTDLPTSFPDYVDPFESSGETIMDSLSPTSALARKLGGGLDDDRHPSPQPSHISVPHLGRANGNGHRILRSATVGYVAPAFAGKSQQMKEGRCPCKSVYMAGHVRG